jgi:hypothetical protein
VIDQHAHVRASSVVPCSWLFRECAKLVGRSKFIDAFEYLKSHFTDSKDSKVTELTKILGKEKVKHWEKIDQLVFMERTNND